MVRESIPLEGIWELMTRPSVQLATPQKEESISSIAVCAGSGELAIVFKSLTMPGGSVLGGVKADLLLTGEMSHVRQVPASQLTISARSPRSCRLWPNRNPMQPLQHGATLPH